MEDDTTRTETDEIAGEDVVIERTVEYKERGAIVTLNIRSRGTAPTTFTLVDEFSDEIPVADAAFHPGSAPDGSRIGPSGISFEEVIEPDEVRTVVYALKFFEPAPDAELGALEILEDEPSREESPVGSRVVARGGTMTTASSTPPSDDEEPSSSDSDVESAVSSAEASASSPSPEESVASSSAEESSAVSSDEGSAASSSAEGSASSPSAEGSASSSSDAESAPSHADVASAPSQSDVESGPSPSDEGSSSSWSADDGETIGATLGLFSGDRQSRRNWVSDGGIRRPSRAASSPIATTDSEIVTVDAGPTTDGLNGRGDSQSSETGSNERGASNGSVPDAPEPVGAGSGVVSALVTELQDGSVDEGKLVALRQELGLIRSTGDEVRIDHLESRMSEFAAYTDALRAVIDEHGTAEQFVSQMEDRIEALRADLTAVESELSATRETVARVDDCVGTLAADFDSLEERTEAELEAIREGLDARDEETEETAEIEAAIERLEHRIENVESLREDF
ncbi:MAG: hypothetical protein R3324_04630, partial [Halobacteriales archaeon]|nr:hypothetical protein [Halobacteriales archaeon]